MKEKNNLKMPKRIRNHVNPLAHQEKVNFDGFNSDNNIIVDVGSYRGEFGARLVDKFEEEKNFIFLEIRKPFQNYLEQLFAEKSNVEIFGGDGGANLKSILEKSIEKGVKIEKIFINFPDPWFKKKHHKRRVVNEEFLNSLKEWLPLETEIIFQTDQKKLFNWTKKIIKKNGFFKISIFSKPLWGIRTYWEGMKIKEGKKIYRMKFQRVEKKIKRFVFF